MWVVDELVMVFWWQAGGQQSRQARRAGDVNDSHVTWSNVLACVHVISAFTLPARLHHPIAIPYVKPKRFLFSSLH